MVSTKVDEEGIKYPKNKKEFMKILDTVHEEWIDDYIKRYENKSIDELFADTTMSFGVSENNRARVINELKKRGYNAMVDEAGVGDNKRGREGVDPLIIFDGDKSLDKTSTLEIDKKTQEKATKEHEKWYDKARNYRYANNYAMNNSKHKKEKYPW